MTFYYGAYMIGGAGNIESQAVIPGTLNTSLTLWKCYALQTSLPTPPVVWTCSLPQDVWPAATTSGTVNVKYGTIINGSLVWTSYPATLQFDIAGNISLSCSQAVQSGQYVGWDNITLPYTMAVAP